MIRINKYLARCGVASRRNADIFVSDGRISVNGNTVTTPGFLVDENTDEVCVDGVVVRPIAENVYLVLNKPAGYVTSLSDPHHRKTVNLLLAEMPQPVYPVGRLDLDTTGVLLFTNDGELAHRLMHPRFKVKKLYRARVKGSVSKDGLKRFSEGITLPDGNIGLARVILEKAGADWSELLLELTEGRKREVKHLCKAVGHPVIRLERISFAGISAGELGPGKWRLLTAEEISGLRALVGLTD